MVNFTSSRIRYADDLNVLNMNVGKMNKFFEVESPGLKIGLEIMGKKTQSLKPIINEGEEVMLRNKKINQANSFTYLGSNIIKDCGCNEDVKRSMGVAECLFCIVNKFGKIERSVFEPRTGFWKLRQWQ